ncbi:MAG: sugar ABC transporter permease [Candidatus Edwardsbacteria bacterium]
MKKVYPLLYLLPALLIIVLFRLFPMVFSFCISLTDYGLGGFRKFVVLQNYSKLLCEPKFWQSFLNTIYYVLGVVPLGLFIALFFALLLNQRIKALGLYRTIYFLPVITSLVAISIVWKWIFNPRIGLANYFLGLLGIPKCLWLEEWSGIFQILLSPLGIKLPPLLAGPSIALCAIILMSIWHGLGYNVIIFLAGLQNIPKHYYEAAKIDGAGTWHSFWYVTWPLLSPTTFFVLLMTTITSFQMFIQVYMMEGPTGGNPLGTTRVLVYYLYEKGFAEWQMGYATALAFVLFVIILCLTLVQRQILARRIHYQ